MKIYSLKSLVQFSEVTGYFQCFYSWINCHASFCCVELFTIYDSFLCCLIKRYAAPIIVDVEYTKGSHDNPKPIPRVLEHFCNLNLTKICIINLDLFSFSQNGVVIGRIPIMLRSCCCVLYGKDEAELAKLGLYEFVMHTQSSPSHYTLVLFLFLYINFTCFIFPFIR